MAKLLEIIGPYPPPLGGISIHIARMEFFLKKEKINYRILNHGFFSSTNVISTNKSSFWYIKYLFTNHGEVIHFHQFFIFHYLYYYIFSLFNKKKIIITIHSEQILYSSSIRKKLCVYFLKKTKPALLISVSKNLSFFLKEKEIENNWLPAVVPAGKINEIRLEKIQKKNYFLYSVWKIDRNTTDSIYNLELALKLLSNIKNEFHMLFLIGTEVDSDKEYLSTLIEKYSVIDSITLIYEGNLINYLNNCNFFLRTNNIDGYGVSIQESLDLKVPAIASDACIRPKGTILFKKNNYEDLYDKVINIKNYWNESIIEKTDYHIQLIELYKKFLH